MLRHWYLIAFAAIFAVGCSKEEASFSILRDADNFQQTTTSFNNKIDVLFVIDNSGSMAPYQQNLSDNFAAFISNFANQGYDFRIAVIGTDAWEAKFYSASSSQNKANFKSTSGIRVLTPSTPDLENKFKNLVKVGTSGYGDERMLQSVEVALDHAPNIPYDFPRSDAYLAVIAVTDEDDFSHEGTCYVPWNGGGGCGYQSNPYSFPNLNPIGVTINYLNTLTDSTSDTKRYNYSIIAALDNACVNNPNSHPDTIVAHRLKQMATATEGVQGSICDSDFASSLNLISQQIAVLSTQFYLSRIPIVSSIVVKVDGALVPKNSTNGWSYVEASNSVRFHGSYIPAEGADISISFDPLTLGD